MLMIMLELEYITLLYLFQEGDLQKALRYLRSRHEGVLYRSEFWLPLSSATVEKVINNLSLLEKNVRTKHS